MSKLQVKYAGLSKKLIDTGQKIQELGLVFGTWGNLSARCAGENSILITPSGMPFTELTLVDLVFVDLEGEITEGIRKPSTETSLHLAIYRARPDVMAIVHTHSLYASAFAVARKPLPPILEEMAQIIGGEVPISAYAPAGSANIAEEATTSLGQGKAVLLANHGLVGVGRDLAEAALVCKLVEKGAQVYIKALNLGAPVQLNSQEVQILREHYLQSYGQGK